MQNFLEILSEGKGGKNLHLEHLEDEIINYGITGGRAAINFLRSLRNMLAGSSSSGVNMTVKWDGAPAIFAGIDPEDGKFFVAKKGVFNADPKFYKTNQEIDAELKGQLNSKFKVALAEIPKLGIKGVLQGDLMFTDDISKKDIDGISYYTFQPNTLVYAIPVDSDLGKIVSKAKLGVVWHTTYEGGPTLQDMTAKFGVNISKLKNTSSIWMDDASYKDVSGKAKFTLSETQKVTKILSDTGKTFQKIKSSELKKFLDVQNNTLTKGLVGASFKTYLNQYVKRGEKFNVSAVKKTPYSMYVKGYFDDKVIAKLKTDKAKKQKEQIRDEVVAQLLKQDSLILNLVEFMSSLVEAKQLIVTKLNSVKQLAKIFVRTKDGYKVSNEEGYVAVDRDGTTAVKLVDRMEFSYNNFTAAKAWDK
tara:strand:+ start:3155 stop:4408 length:1254 start_codon:yes stop_codon:yes gene_type:complete